MRHFATAVVLLLVCSTPMLAQADTASTVSSDKKEEIAKAATDLAAFARLAASSNAGA